MTSGAVNETLQEKVGLRFEKSFLSVQEKLTGMHGTFDDVKETLGCMKDTFPPTQEGKSCKVPSLSPLLIGLFCIPVMPCYCTGFFCVNNVCQINFEGDFFVHPG